MNNQVNRILLFVCSLLVYSWSVTGQQTTDYLDKNVSFETGLDLFEKNLFASAAKHFQEYLNIDQVIYQEEGEILKKKALFYKALSNLKAHPKKGKEELLEFANIYSNDPLATSAYFNLGRHFYNVKNYDLAIQYYNRVSLQSLTDLEKSDLHFRKGYCHFVKKEFDRAELSFRLSKDQRNKYYYPTNYYYGMCAYFKNDFNEASKSFERVNGSTIYGPFIPSYLAQIYFAQGKYNKAITYIEQELKKPDVTKKISLHQILGQSYYLTKDYEKALTHLEVYESNTEKLTEEEFYQLAYTQYRLQYYDKAISNFKELALLQNNVGHNANYYLADCYIKKNDKEKARTAFRTVSNMDYIIAYKDEALFNFAKLSAEMDYDTEAIEAFSKMVPSSEYYLESQQYLSTLFLESEDYLTSINILEKLPNQSEDLKNTYEQVLYAHASRLYSDNQKANAIPFYQRVIQMDRNKSLIKDAYYWIAQYQYDTQEYDLSIESLTTYNEIKTEKKENKDFAVQYLLGYTHLKKKQYEEAGLAFDNALSVGKNQGQTDALFQRQYRDALVRSGDCYFKSKNYVKAFKGYNTYIASNQPNPDYAIFQKGLIQGLLSQPYDKLVTLDELAKNYPSSPYADDALMEIGTEYLSLNNQTNARSAFQKIVSEYKNSSIHVNKAYVQLGLINYNAGDKARAIDYYKAVFANNPNGNTSQEALNALQEIYVEDLNDSEGYISFVESLPGFNLDDFSRDSLSFRTADVLYKKAEYEQAITGFDAYLNQFSNGFYYLEAYYKRAESQAVIKNYVAALRDYEYIIAEGRNRFFEKSLSKAALIAYNHQENFEKALEYFIQIEETTNDEGTKNEAQIGALRSSYKMGNRESAMFYASTIQEHKNLNSDIRAYTHYILAKLNYEAGNYVDAIPHLEKVSQLSKNIYAAESKYLLAQIAFKNQDLTSAEKLAQKAYKQSSSYQYWVGKSLLLLSDIYIEKEDYISARAAVEAIQEKYKDNDDVKEEATSKLILIKALQESNNRIIDRDNSDTLIMENSGGNEK